jgi:hypothetical protein
VGGLGVIDEVTEDVPFGEVFVREGYIWVGWQVAVGEFADHYAVMVSLFIEVVERAVVVIKGQVNIGGEQSGVGDGGVRVCVGFGTVYDTLNDVVALGFELRFVTGFVDNGGIGYAGRRVYEQGVGEDDFDVVGLLGKRGTRMMNDLAS